MLAWIPPRLYQSKFNIHARPIRAIEIRHCKPSQTETPVRILLHRCWWDRHVTASVGISVFPVSNDLKDRGDFLCASIFKLLRKEPRKTISSCPLHQLPTGEKRNPRHLSLCWRLKPAAWAPAPLLLALYTGSSFPVGKAVVGISRGRASTAHKECVEAAL